MTKQRQIFGALTGLILASSATAALANEARPLQDPLAVFQGAPKIKTSNGNYWKLRGRIMYDIASLSESPINSTKRSIDDSEFRTARLGVEGVVGDFKFTVEADFVGSKTTYKNVNIKWKTPAGIAVQAGQSKAGGSMEELISGRHTTFIERGMITDAIGFDRRIGISATGGTKTYGFSAGVYGNSINGALDGKATNTIFAARTHYAPIMEKGNVLHIGGSMRHTDRALGAPSHSARWGSHLAAEKIKPTVGDAALLFGIETARVRGPFHMQAEYMSETGDLGTVDGGFIQAGYFITGEMRAYKGGKFGRTKPKTSLSAGGFGAFEVAARFDRLDARGAGDEKVDAFTAGLNWYPETHARISVNYTKANGDTFDADGVYLRLQMDW